MSKEIKDKEVKKKAPSKKVSKESPAKEKFFIGNCPKTGEKLFKEI